MRMLLSASPATCNCRILLSLSLSLSLSLFLSFSFFLSFSLKYACRPHVIRRVTKNTGHPFILVSPVISVSTCVQLLPEKYSSQLYLMTGVSEANSHSVHYSHQPFLSLFLSLFLFLPVLFLTFPLLGFTFSLVSLFFLPSFPPFPSHVEGEAKCLLHLK